MTTATASWSANSSYTIVRRSYSLRPMQQTVWHYFDWLIDHSFVCRQSLFVAVVLLESVWCNSVTHGDGVERAKASRTATGALIHSTVPFWRPWTSNQAFTHTLMSLLNYWVSLWTSISNDLHFDAMSKFFHILALFSLWMQECRNWSNRGR